ncbi:MAG TPA: copper-binding protein [Sphingomicrobium sp.]|nr:copper-binding protein [Sphingomicrobium sp.]
MTISIRPAGVLALALLLAACGEKTNAAPENGAAATDGQQSSLPDKVYSATGTVKSVTGDQVAIAHGPIEGIGWPAMTMTFTAPPDIAASAKAGVRVDFSFRQEGSAYVLTSVKPT